MSNNALIHVVDDDEALRSSLVFLLASASFEARAYESARAFLESLSDAGAGCIVTDVRMPGMSGIDLLRNLKARDSNLPVIVMTGHGDVPLAVEAMKAGAFDFIEKPFDDETMLAAVRAALARSSDVRTEDAQRVEILARIASLTQRERDVFDGLVAGHPNKTIAHDLGISPRTVEVYRANVMTKLQAASLSEVVRMAFIAEGGARSRGDLAG